jgi:hypothetical protein
MSHRKSHYPNSRITRGEHSNAQVPAARKTNQKNYQFVKLDASMRRQLGSPTY